MCTLCHHTFLKSMTLTLLTYLLFDALSKGAFATLNRKISMLTCPPLDKIERAWEHDLGHTLSADQKDSILTSIHKFSFCARHCLMQLRPQLASLSDIMSCLKSEMIRFSDSDSVFCKTWGQSMTCILTLSLMREIT